MDLEGGWNPPEEWPEATPPLPGWVRGDDNRWRPPTDDEGAVREPSPSEVEAERRFTLTEGHTRKPLAQQPAPRRTLRYSEAVHRGESEPVADAAKARRALSAAALAAITASMIAGGMVLLLLLL